MENATKKLINQTNTLDKKTKKMDNAERLKGTQTIRLAKNTQEGGAPTANSILHQRTDLQTGQTPSEGTGPTRGERKQLHKKHGRLHNQNKKALKKVDAILPKYKRIENCLLDCYCFCNKPL